MSASGDENDSRTASVGLQRNLNNGSNNSSRHSSHERSRKKQKRLGDRDVRDFVPQGATFSAYPLEVDPKSTPSSDTGSSGDEGSVDANNKTASDPNTRIDENQEGSTRISSNEAVNKDGYGKSASQFHAVNDRYWRSRSDSVSSDEDNASSEGDDSEDSDDDDSTSGSGSSHLSDDSDDSGSMDSEEADDSIMVNVGSVHENRNGGLSTQGSEYDTESRRVIEEGLLNGSAGKVSEESPYSQSKEEALHRFSQKYPTAPSTLVDLGRHDFEVQAKYLYYDRDINDVNLDLPVGCIECLQPGHLAEVCPSKEVRYLLLSQLLSHYTKLARADNRIVLTITVCTLWSLERTSKQLLSLVEKMSKMPRARPR